MTTKDYQKKHPLMIFLSFFKRHKGLFALDMGCAIAMAVIDLAFPLVTRTALYDLLPNQLYRTFFTIMAVVVLIGLVYFMIMSWQYNALLSGEATARTMGIHVDPLRFASMLLASLITAVCVSFLGVIGVVGIICPHVVKKLLGQDHRVTIPVTALSGSLLLLFADTLSRSMGGGSALPVGAITSLLGAPFFLAIIFSRKENRRC